jgi:hypothetical protein
MKREERNKKRDKETIEEKGSKKETMKLQKFLLPPPPPHTIFISSVSILQLSSLSARTLRASVPRNRCALWKFYICTSYDLSLTLEWCTWIIIIGRGHGVVTSP